MDPLVLCTCTLSKTHIVWCSVRAHYLRRTRNHARTQNTPLPEPNVVQRGTRARVDDARRVDEGTRAARCVWCCVRAYNLRRIRTHTTHTHTHTGVWAASLGATAALVLEATQVNVVLCTCKLSKTHTHAHTHTQSLSDVG